MKLTAIDVPGLYGSLYRSDKYDLLHTVGGFGMSVVRVFVRGNNRMVKEFAGEGALAAATAYCRERDDDAAA